MKTLFNNKIWNFFFGLIIFFIFFCCMQLLSFVPLLSHLSDLPADEEQLKNIIIPFTSYIFIGSTLFPLLMIYFFTRSREKPFIESFKLYVPKRSNILLYLHHIIVFTVFIECISLYFPGVLEENFTEIIYINTHSKIVLYISVVIFAPIFEELVFRGLMFDGLKEKFGTGFAIFIPALLFALAHLGQYGFWICFLMVMPMGLLFGYARLQSKTLTLPIILHALNNFIACLFLYFEFY